CVRCGTRRDRSVGVTHGAGGRTHPRAPSHRDRGRGSVSARRDYWVRLTGERIRSGWCRRQRASKTKASKTKASKTKASKTKTSKTKTSKDNKSEKAGITKVIVLRE